MGKSVSSRTSAWRARWASLLSAGLRQGEPPPGVSLRQAALSLMQRGRALKGIKRAGPEAVAERLVLANEARRQKRERRIQHERMDRLSRPWRESTRSDL